jgi:hypothetical protein
LVLRSHSAESAIVRVGRLVRIPESAIVELIEAGSVEPISATTSRIGGLA